MCCWLVWTLVSPADAGGQVLGGFVSWWLLMSCLVLRVLGDVVSSFGFACCLCGLG